MEDRYTYRVTSTWMTGKFGIVEAADCPVPVEFAAPPAFGGEDCMWTPEHLFLSAVGACFVTTFRAIAEFSKLEYLSLEVPVEGVLEKVEKGYRFTQVILRPELALARDEDAERGQRLLEKAERACLISRSITAEIKLQPKIKAPEAVAV
jgi:peroxiredoxin-like protein